MTVFRAYLRDFAGAIGPDSKIVTRNANEALDVFKGLVCRVELDGQKMIAVLSRDGAHVASHRFDRCRPGDSDYWRDKLDELPDLLATGPVGRPATLTGGRRVNVYLDAEAVAIAERLGDKNVSDGIRRALRLASPNFQP